MTRREQEEPPRPRWPATRHRRRTFIPMLDREQQPIGCLVWRGQNGMEAYTADGTSIGRFLTRRAAASALWRIRSTKERSAEMMPGWIGPPSGLSTAEGVAAPSGLSGSLPRAARESHG